MRCFSVYVQSCSAQEVFAGSWDGVKAEDVVCAGRTTQTAQFEVPGQSTPDSFASFENLLSTGGLCASRTTGNLLCAPSIVT